MHTVALCGVLVATAPAQKPGTKQLTIKCFARYTVLLHPEGYADVQLTFIHTSLLSTAFATTVCYVGLVNKQQGTDGCGYDTQFG